MGPSSPTGESGPPQQPWPPRGSKLFNMLVDEGSDVPSIAAKRLAQVDAVSAPKFAEQKSTYISAVDKLPYVRFKSSYLLSHVHVKQRQKQRTLCGKVCFPAGGSEGGKLRRRLKRTPQEAE